MTRPIRAAGDQLQGLLMHGEQMLDRMEARTPGLRRLPASALYAVLGACLGMLIGYGLHLQTAAVSFEIVGPLMGGAGAAIGVLASHDRAARKREEKVRLDKFETASRLQMAAQIVDFLRGQGRNLPPDVKEGALDEVNRLLSNPKALTTPPRAMLTTLMPPDKVD